MEIFLEIYFRLRALVIYQKMKVIVIGGSGYVGSNIAKHIDAEKVSYYSRSRNSELDGKGIDWIQGDILNAESVMTAVKDYDMIVDAAGIDTEADQKFFDVNVNGVKNIVAALNQYDTDQRLVYLSSINVHYGTTEFFRTKRTGEDNAALVKNHLNVRPSVVFGNGDRFTEKLFSLTASKVSKLPSGGFISPVHVEDLVRVIERAKDLRGAVDVCSREKITFADAINLAFERTGKGPRKVVTGKFGYSSSVESLKAAGPFTADEVDKYLLNFYRENSYLDRFVNSPVSFRDYISNYKLD